VTSALLTPFTAGEAVELGNRVWRKKLLPVGDVEYKGRTLHFTRDYLGRLVTAFQSRAYDQVPFQLADHANAHTNDPERTRGEITSMELGDDGLYITAQVTPDGEKVLEANPKLGVSARIVEDYARSDGQFFKNAVQHVLGTLDPRIPGLGAWEAIEAASPVPDQVNDMSAGSYTALTADAPQDKAARKAAKAQRKAEKQQSGSDARQQTNPASDPAGADPEGGADMADLTKEQRARLDKLLALPDDILDALAAGGTVLTPAELEALTAPDKAAEDGEPDEASALADEIAAMSDEELAALEAEFNAEAGDGETTEDHVTEGEPVAAGLSAEAQFEISLAYAKAEETQREMSVIQARLREQDYQAEKRKLGDIGVPPRITEMARPVLEGIGHVIEMANGKSVDVGQIMRAVLTEYAQMVRLLDLDVELGSPMDEPDDAGREDAEQSRQALVSNFKSMTGLK
jgi:hypothetical protein